MARTGILIDNQWRESESGRTIDVLAPATGQPFATIAAEQEDFPFALFTTREAPERPPFLTFDGLIGDTAFVEDLRTVLGCLHAAYAHAVEIEFALNVRPPAGAQAGQGEAPACYRINLLQCRPLQVRSLDGSGGEAPPADAPRVLSAQGAVIGPSRVIRPRRLLWVHGAAFAALRQAERVAVARLVGRLNQLSAGCELLLAGPGRWGSRDPFLGVPVVFAEINHVAALCEIVAMHENLVPDVSLGTHFINELIEADLLYFALFPQRPGNAVDEAWLAARPNALSQLLPEEARWAEVVQVIELPIFSAMADLMRRARPIGSARPAPSSLQVSSSMLLIASIGTTVSISERSAWCARR
mgnify:CR=1 FL=1